MKKLIVLGSMIPIASCALTGCVRVNPNLKASGYYDTRNLPTSTVTVVNVDSAHGNTIFAYADMETESKFPKYAEANITQRIYGPFGGLVEYGRNFNVPKGVHRFGMTYQIPQLEVLRRGRFGIKYTPFSTHGHGSQISVAGTMPMGPDMSVDGYFDYNIKEEYTATDWQVGRRIKKSVYGVVEYRFNGSRRRDATSLAFGLEWRIR